MPKHVRSPISRRSSSAADRKPSGPVGVAMDTVHLLWEGGNTMIRRFPWLRLVLSALCLVFTGCEPHSSWLRHNDDDDLPRRGSDVKAVDSDASKISAVDSDSKRSRPFFDNSRPSLGWSSQAREIEKDLGID